MQVKMNFLRQKKKIIKGNGKQKIQRNLEGHCFVESKRRKSSLL